MDVQEVTATVAERLKSPTRRDVNVHYGEADEQDVRYALRDPKGFAAAAGVATTDESQYRVSVLKREDRHRGAVSPEARAARRPIIIIIHYECCCGEVWVLGW
jgi:hypothetical protein